MRSSSPEEIIVLCNKWRCEAVCMSRFVELVFIWSLIEGLCKSSPNVRSGRILLSQIQGNQIGDLCLCALQNIGIYISSHSDITASEMF